MTIMVADAYVDFAAEWADRDLSLKDWQAAGFRHDPELLFFEDELLEQVLLHLPRLALWVPAAKGSVR